MGTDSQWDPNDLSEDLDVLLSEAITISPQCCQDRYFWQIVRKARQEMNHKAMGALQRCHVCWKRTKNKCSRCKVAYYCSMDCSTKDWKIPKAKCKLYSTG